MSARALSVYDTYIKPSSKLMEIPVLLTFNLLLIATSYLTLNIPFSPVPITGQTFGVLLIAMTLGKTRGSTVVLAYLAEGAMGLPVFAGGKSGMAALMGPTGGYLLGFLASAYLVGYLADRGWDKHWATSVFAMIFGTALIFVFGLIWLSRFIGGESVMMLGFYPYLPGAVVKIIVASVILPSVWKFVGKK